MRQLGVIEFDKFGRQTQQTLLLGDTSTSTATLGPKMAIFYGFLFGMAATLIVMNMRPRMHRR